jgi:hypothetical protein
MAELLQKHDANHPDSLTACGSQDHDMFCVAGVVRFCPQ